MRYLKIASIILLASLVMVGCKKNPKPTPELPQEELDETQIVFVLLDEDQNPTTDSTKITFDISGYPSPSHLHLDIGHDYLMLINISYRGRSINQEIIDDGDMHQFFFIADHPALIQNYQYLDQDKNGLPIGLKGIISLANEEIDTDLHVILRHGLNKNHPSAQTYNHPNYRDAGGSDDLNIFFNIHLMNEHDDH